MRVFIAVLVLIFSFQSWTKADDISDFEIEGMSIGDSALDFFSESEIKNNSFDYYNNKLFTPVQTSYLPFFKTYDGLDFDFKTNDKDYFVAISTWDIRDKFETYDDVGIILKTNDKKYKIYALQGTLHMEMKKDDHMMTILQVKA